MYMLIPGCPDGSWGTGCGLQCPSDCQYSCDDITGKCTGETTLLFTIHINAYVIDAYCHNDCTAKPCLSGMVPVKIT